MIGGYLQGQTQEVGALLVGYREGKVLRYAGRVGVGYTQRSLLNLRALLGPRHQAGSPFEEYQEADPRAVWVRPELVREVEFHEWTEGGKLRHPAFKGLRTDKRPDEVVREPG